MVIARNTCFAAAFLATLIISLSSFLVNVQSYPSVAYPPNSWINDPVFDISFWDSAGISPILITGNFVCGFHCQASFKSNCLFGISILETNFFEGNNVSSPSQIVWSANRNNLVKMRATLQLSEKGDLMLQDSDGTLVWNTNTAGKFVSGLNLTQEGNLVLYGRNNEKVWQSFDHPTDILVPGQALVSGQKLTANASISNSTAGLYSFALMNDSLLAFLEADAQQQVYFGPWKVKTYGTEQQKIVYMNGRFGPFVFPSASASQFIRLESDGHLKAYQLRESKWEQASDLLINYTDACTLPLACGKYGICSNGHCSCPKTEGSETAVYFSQVSKNNPNLGCYENLPISCEPSDYHRHSLLELEDVDYFNFIPHIKFANRKWCKEACLKNCSCKAVIHRQPTNSSAGSCYLLSEIYFSFKRNNDRLLDYASVSYIKVQNPATSQTTSGSNRTSTRKKITILGSTLGPILFILFVVLAISIFLRNKNKSKDGRKGPRNHSRLRFTRFSYDNLCAMTENFSMKLGQGGFGSVFYGSLPDSTKIAVKRLDGSGHVMKSFVAEVETLATVHHINLVTLIGFCAEKSHRLLIYEYMQNGSLDRWIFSKNPECSLSWKSRKKIIHDVANGLAYLHEGCNRKILHLDVKPQNILLDENFNARLVDFGLSKLIDRDQNQVLTTMRGTPGYMAPEWSSATITEKVDVYSFGIVVLEIVCSRRNVDKSQPEEEMHLLRLFRKNAEEGKLMELVDKFNEDLNGAEAVKIMKIAAWCLQANYTKRPPMSTVLKVLKGNVNVEDNLSYDFLNLQEPRAIANPSNIASTSTLPLPSMLSGPR